MLHKYCKSSSRRFYGGFGIVLFVDCGCGIGEEEQPEFWSGFPSAHACWHERASEESLQQPNLQLWPVPRPVKTCIIIVDEVETEKHAFYERGI